MRSDKETDFIFKLREFDFCENDTNINNLSITPKLGEGVPLGPKMCLRRFGAIFLRFHINKFSKYTKFRNSFVINCSLVLIWKLPFNLKLTFLNKIAIFSHKNFMVSYSGLIFKNTHFIVIFFWNLFLTPWKDFIWETI